MSWLCVHQTLWILWVGGHGRRGFPKSTQKQHVFEHPSFVSMPRVRKSLHNTMEINGFEFGMCFGEVTNCCFFVLQYVVHITTLFCTCCFVPFWNPSRIGFVCLVVVFAPNGSGSRSNGVRNVWRAVAQHIFLSMSRLFNNCMFFIIILGASFLPTRFPMWFCAHSATAMSGLCDVDSQRWPLRMPNLPAARDS